MKKTLLARSLLLMSLGAAGLITTNTACASAFQLWEQDAAGVGDYHAGGAAEADSASTTYYNPAGLTRMKNQQVIIGTTLVDTTIPFKGTVNVSTLFTTTPDQAAVNTEAGGINLIPDLYYATPLTSKLAFGFGVITPFGLKTAYQGNTYANYAATTTSITVTDLTPSLAYQIIPAFSLGAGLDVQYLQGVFNQYGTLFFTSNNTHSGNSGDAWGLGYHIGGLLQYNNQHTRIGLTYHSDTNYSMRGKSKFIGPLANSGTAGSQVSNNLKANITTPSFAELSLFQVITSQWAVMGSVTYTWWDTFNRLRLFNIASISALGIATNQTEVTVAENYRNTLNYALGVHYTPISRLTFKAGIGFDHTPSHLPERNLQLPDADRFALAFGGHYQLDKHLGVDAGWTHLFITTANISNTQALGSEVVVSNGYSHSSANIYGLQFTYDFA